MAQALHYAAWVRTLSWEQIAELATRFLALRRTSLGAPCALPQTLANGWAYGEARYFRSAEEAHRLMDAVRRD